MSQARDGERVAGGHVYVIPPGTLMGLSDGTIRLEPRGDRASAPKPIDHFMAALADDAGNRSMGIVLSGTDHDGTAGLKAIKAAGEPDTVHALIGAPASEEREP